VVGRDLEYIPLSSIPFDIQRFADPDKTEKATPRRRQKAREEGQTAYSKDLAMAVVFIGLLVILFFLAGSLVANLGQIISFFLSLPNRGEMDDPQVIWEYLIIEGQQTVLLVLLALFGGFFLALFLGLYQTKLMISLKSLKFDLNRINPISGFKRLFSLRSVVELMKNLVKLAILGFIGWAYITGLWEQLFLLPDFSVEQSMGFMGHSLFQMGLQIGVALLALGFFDFFYQKWEFERNIRMSKKEVKDEYKDIEGNPEIKRKQREKMQEILNKRMMQEVPSATVVVTNPTHYAVALRFELEVMDAPVVVAKGVDPIAQRIKDIASDHDVPIIENPPLAKSLYEKVDIGESIPVELYQLVAEVLAHVFKTAKSV